MEKSTDWGSIERNTFLDKVIFVQCFFSLEELQKVQISRKAAWKFHALISSKYFGIIIYLFSWEVNSPLRGKGGQGVATFETFLHLQEVSHLEKQ